jgi:hypothetical protein
VPAPAKWLNGTLAIGYEGAGDKGKGKWEGLHLFLTRNERLRGHLCASPDALPQLFAPTRRTRDRGEGRQAEG